MKHIKFNNMLKAGITFLFLVLFAASCTPSQAYTRDPEPRNNDQVQEREKVFHEEEFIFNDDDRGTPVVQSRTIHGENDFRRANNNTTGRRPYDNHNSNERFYETGMASWYGREFHGKTTASGENFDMYDMTAAHKTLPFGTIIEVKNLETGQTARVRVNDRGPYRGERIIDLSYNAARNLDMIQNGEAEVGIKILEEGDGSSRRAHRDTPGTQSVAGPSSSFEYEVPRSSQPRREPESFSRGGYTIQAGAFYSQRNANNLRDRIQNMTGNRVNVVKEGDFFKVKVEGIHSRNEAESFSRRLSDRNIPSYIINP